MRAWLTLLALLALASVVLAGCGAGDAGSSQESGGEKASKERLGHPSLGSADAPVVLTEYSDYQ